VKSFVVKLIRTAILQLTAFLWHWGDELAGALWYFPGMTFWIDTHCHLDSEEFVATSHDWQAQAAINNVAICVIPAVSAGNFETVRKLAHSAGHAYALGIHPLCVKAADDSDLTQLDAQLSLHRNDPRLVAVGEIGLDFFVPALCESPLRERQEFFYHEQLKLAKKYDLPVILHVRRSADRLLKYLRDVGGNGFFWKGITHAFNGSEVQAHAFIKLGFKLGFGGAVTYQRALQLRHLATTLPLDAIVMETDAPDMPPKWLYKTAAQRAAGEAQGINSPAELPQIAAEIAMLRNLSLDEFAVATTQNAINALPGLNSMLL
jgi:TatD DNase family protein